MKKAIVILIGFVAVGFASAQDLNLLNASSPEEFAQKLEEKHLEESEENKPLEYGEIESRDIMWSKIVWEVVDMEERINQAYYNSSDGVAGIGRKSLYTAIVDAVKSGAIKEVYTDETFSTKTTFEQAMSSTAIVDSAWYNEKLMNGEEVSSDDLDVHEMRDTDVTLFKVMGMWYIDKKLGEMRYRPLGIAFMGLDIESLSEGIVDDSSYDLFWVWYADARQTLFNTPAFSDRNSSAEISFDDMVNARRFNSLIYKAQNSKGDREITTYCLDAECQLKAGREISEEIRDKEQDLWQF